MAPRFTFTDDSDDVRLSGFLDPEPALTAGGTIEGAVTIAPPATAANVPDLRITSSHAALDYNDVIKVTSDAGTLYDLQSDGGSAQTLREDTSGYYVLVGASGLLLYNNAGTAQLGFFNKAATSGAAQPLAIANAAGGAIIDAEARTALNALLAAMRTLGLIAT